MVYDKRNARRWSIMGERPTFGLAVHECARENADIIAVVADISGSAGLERMRKEMPDRVINVGIAEQNMMGIATGLASEGFTVFTTSFAPFQTMRCLEQIRVNQGYMGQKVIMTGLAAGAAYGELGFTHCTIEDVGVLRSIPNIAIVTPADCTEVVKTVEAAISYEQSVYIRLLGKTNVPVVYSDDYHFEIGKSICLADGESIAVLANGTAVYPSLQAMKRIVEETGTQVAVFDFHTTKPLDCEILDKIMERFAAVLTVEEHSMIGGLGSAVSEYYSEKKYRIPVYKMGMPDAYPHGASHETLLSELDLTDEGIYNKIKLILEELS